MTKRYGDVYPTSEWEMLLGIAAMLFGAIFLTGLFSSGLTSFELEHDGARFDLFYRVEAMMKHLVSAFLFICDSIKYINNDFLTACFFLAGGH